ncbi:MAG: hypothetical protein IJI66_03835 [Erysipelotrichaceae bacterium]|nr:hypothetical protein [Erysipelotrichaceae bacterium]
MTEISVREYDAKLDSKKRITLRNAIFEYFHVSELEDGRIILEPRELVKPFSVSANTLSMMDKAVENIKDNKVSGKLDLSKFED